MFTSEVSNVTVPVEIYDDNVAEGPETFLVCLPNLEATNTDVMLINSVQPDCVRVNIIDDDSKKRVYMATVYVLLNSIIV